MFSEFREFINKGNAMDLAVGVIIGAAFGKIVDSLVADIIMPVVGLATGGVDFSQRFIPLNHQTGMALDEARKHGAVLAYGSFIQTVMNFLIVAFVVFLMVRQMNSVRGVRA